MPRLAAAVVLEKIETKESFSNVALDNALRNRQLNSKDAGLATELVYGVLKNQTWLDDVLGRWLAKPIKRLSPFTRAVLRTGAYQLLMLDRVPAHAAVSESVRLIKMKNKRVAGVANAVLRRISENANSLKLETSRTIEDARDLCRAFSWPLWLAEQHIAQWGLDEAIEYARAVRRPPPTTVRCRRAEDREKLLECLKNRDLAAKPTQFSPLGVQIEAKGKLHRLLVELSDTVLVQDEGSQLVGFFVGPKPKQRILDLCAGRGGKAFLLADLRQDQGSILATEIHQHKLTMLEKTARQLGIGSVQVSLLPTNQTETSHIAPDLHKSFDVVLLDAPCSGLGALRRHPELSLRTNDTRLKSLARLQRQLLDEAARLVKPGGILVYVVCSDLPAEGPGRIEEFLQLSDDFVADTPPQNLDWSELTDENGFLRLFPHRHGCDGFFACRMRKRGSR